MTATGTWIKTGERTVALFLGTEWIDIWTFEPGGKAVKAVGYSRNGGYDAKATP